MCFLSFYRFWALEDNSKVQKLKLAFILLLDLPVSPFPLEAFSEAVLYRLFNSNDNDSCCHIICSLFLISILCNVHQSYSQYSMWAVSVLLLTFFLTVHVSLPKHNLRYTYDTV